MLLVGNAEPLLRHRRFKPTAQRHRHFRTSNARNLVDSLVDISLSRVLKFIWIGAVLLTETDHCPLTSSVGLSQSSHFNGVGIGFAGLAKDRPMRLDFNVALGVARHRIGASPFCQGHRYILKALAELIEPVSQLLIRPDNIAGRELRSRRLGGDDAFRPYGGFFGHLRSAEW